MKIIVEKDDNIKSDEIIIRCNNDNYMAKEIEDYIQSINNCNISFFKKDHEYFININDIIFFETDINSISAHTINDVYCVKYKLYELEQILPNNFIRVSKSTIININHIYSINKNITSPSIIEFNKTHKKIFVSRFYFKNLKEKMKEKR